VVKGILIFEYKNVITTRDYTRGGYIVGGTVTIDYIKRYGIKARGIMLR